jgi:glycosyltransferase involved in cell wall biosynthesis
VNVCGYLRAENGLGAVARGYLDAIEARWIPTSRRDISALSPGRASDRSVERLDHAHPYGVNLVCANADEHPAVRELVGEDFFRGRYNIGVWFWELPEFPDVWRDRFASFDEIWVASASMADAIAPAAPIPVLHVPPVLAPRGRGSRVRGRRSLGLSPDEFVFLFVFDFHGYPERKNPLAVIEAFRRAFAPGEPARLVLKCVNEGSRPEVFAAMGERAGGRRIELHAGYWDRGEMRDLLEACDAYVSLHRAEGLGLTLAEAMAVGKPVVATGWSGNLEFMDVANSYLVRYDLVQIERDVGPYRRGQVWAEPSVDHAAELMRRVYEARDEARERGRRARRDLAARFSEDAVGGRIAERLKIVGRQASRRASRR